MTSSCAETIVGAVAPAAARTATAAPDLLVVQGLAKRFEIHHLDRQVATFEAVNFTLNAGEFLMLGGANGTGKSTLLRTLYRSCRTDTGKAVYRSTRGPVDLLRAADVDIAWLRRAEIGFVTQFLQARPRISAEDLVAEPLLQAGHGHRAAIDEAHSWLDAFGLKRALWPAYPSAFSGGEQQKVNLARALIRPRRLLLLDEPTASLDRVARRALVARLDELKRAGVAMIGVFHFPEDVEPLVDKWLSLDAGMGPTGGVSQGNMADVAE